MYIDIKSTILNIIYSYIFIAGMQNADEMCRLDIPSKYTLWIYPLDILSRYTLLIYPLDVPSRYPLLIYPLDIPS